ncbi:carboxylesterase family protein [Winogradskyella maritima]|nr:carboxylesterase family protein [Winogradskyella maritima]
METADVNSGANLPVMVWIHGGGFVGGSGSGAGIAGDEFAKKGVVLITINYRLGRLGHFAFPALSAEHPEEHKVAMLIWIRLRHFSGYKRTLLPLAEIQIM